MTTYNTGNPVGSTDPKDLYDNAQNLDALVNSTTELSHADRLAVQRKTWRGMETQFDAAQAERAGEFAQFLADSAYQDIGVYGAGIEVTRYNQVFLKDGEFYRPAASLGLPYTTTGMWASESGSFVGVGDAVLRQDLAASGGSALVGYMPGGLGAMAQNLQKRLRKTVFLSEYIPDGTNTATTNCSPYVQAAVDAVPSGGTLIVDVVGTVLLDTDYDKYVPKQSGTTRYLCAVLVNKPMRVIGSASCIFKIKDFSTGWTQTVNGDLIAAWLVNSSSVEIDGLHIDANADNHYELDGDEFKWWETGPLLRRPPSGITVLATKDAPSITNVLVQNCVIDRPLAGVTFQGNMENEINSAFLNRTRTTGTVEGCVARNNTVRRHRGNGILMVAGVTACRSERNRMVNGMYHAVRFYSAVVDSVSVGDVDFVDCAAVVARYNSTDNGYWRTNKTASEQFKIRRTGFCAGGMWNYVSGTHNILNCEFHDIRGTLIPLQSGHTSYYLVDQGYASGVSSYEASPPGLIIKGAKLTGYWRGGQFLSFLTVPVADRYGVVLENNTFENSISSGLYMTNTPNSRLIGNRFVGNDVAGGTHAYFDSVPGSFVSENTCSAGTKTGARIGLRFLGDTTSVRLGRNYFDTGTPLAQQVFQEAASTPKLPVTSASTVPAFTNGWAASTYQSGITGSENTFIAQQESGFLQLNLRLDSTGATTADVMTLPEGLRPRSVISALAVDAVNGSRYFARILTTGIVQVRDIPGTGKPTALYLTFTYSVF